MRTQVKIVTPSEHWALRARPGKCAAPRHIDVVDARANMRTVRFFEQRATPSIIPKITANTLA